MNNKPVLCVLPLILTSISTVADDSTVGYYGSAKYLQIEQHAKEMGTSSRPGVPGSLSAPEKRSIGAVEPLLPDITPATAGGQRLSIF